MSLLLAVSAGLAGALAGFVLGVLAALVGLEGAPKPLAALVVAVAVVLDLAGRPRPPSVARQVPRSWARLFPLRVAAVLYGARLGVGPFTILSTWVWWAAVVVGAAAGPWWSVATGAAFGVGRVLVMVGVAARIEGDAVVRMAAVRDRERVVRRAALAGAVVAAAVLLAACTGGDSNSARDGDGGDGGRGPTTSTTATGDAVPGDDADGSTGALDEVLLAEVGDDYRRVPDDSRAGLGLLDLKAAAEVEVDTSAERSLLVTRGFRRGLARAWRNEAGDELYQAVYEFGDEAGAAAYLKDGLITLEGRAAELYPVEGVPGATGFSQAERRPKGAVTSHGLVFVRGHRFFLVFASSAKPGTTPAHVAEVGRAADARQATGSAAPS